MTDLSKIIPTQIRNDSPELFESPGSDDPANTNSISIQIHESYDICNDDINEEYAVSYENDYLTNNDTLHHTNPLRESKPTDNYHAFFRPIARTPPTTHERCVMVMSPPPSPSFTHSITPHSKRVAKQLQKSFLQKVNNELSTSRTNQHGELPVSIHSSIVGEHSAFDTFDASFSEMEGNYIKTDSMLFHPFDKNTKRTHCLPFATIANEKKSSPDIPRTPMHNSCIGVDVRTSPICVAKSGGSSMPEDGATSNTHLQSHTVSETNCNTRSKLINAFLMTNSPLSSQTNSDAELSDNETGGVSTSRYLIQEHVENAISNRRLHFKKISYEEIERSLSKYYDKNNKYSNEVDILITFIRGQKHLYNQSCYITQIKLYALTITALSITTLITVMTPFIQQYWWKIIFVMSGNAITTVLITILKYMRFESACNTFTLLSNHYEHYEHSLQITSNKLVFIQDETEQTKTVLDKMQEIEFKMRETKELCPIIIPVEVQNSFPVIYQTNIFTLIKKMDTHRKTLILQLKNIKNEIRYILYKWNTLSGASALLVDDENTPLVENAQLQREKIRLLFLMEQKERIKKELIEYKDNYTQIDDLFMKEIKYAETNKKWLKWLCCNTQKIQYNSYTNPVIKEHLELILS